MFALMVDGGEVNRLMGVFDSEDKVHAVIQSVRVDCECTDADGFLMTDITHPEGDPNMKVLSVHETDIFPDNYSILFTVVSLELNQEFDVAVS